MEFLFTSESLISFLVLVILEIVLGIDNVIFVSIIMNRLPKEKQKRARLIWMAMGILTRCALLFGLSWLLAQKGITVLRLFGNDLDSLFNLDTEEDYIEEETKEQIISKINESLDMFKRLSKYN